MRNWLLVDPEKRCCKNVFKGRLKALYGAQFWRILAIGGIFGHLHMPGSIRSWTVRYRSAVGRDGVIVERGGLITGTGNNYGGFVAGLAGLPSLSARSGRS